jgi:hypothetical protein
VAQGSSFLSLTVKARPIRIIFFYRDIIKILKAEGRKLTHSLPINASVGNMVRRILKIIREEYLAGQQVRLLEITELKNCLKNSTSMSIGLGFLFAAFGISDFACMASFGCFAS